MTGVPELSPQDVGCQVPVAHHISLELYTYDYIIIGGSFLVVFAVFVRRTEVHI